MKFMKYIFFNLGNSPWIACYASKICPMFQNFPYYTIHCNFAKLQNVFRVREGADENTRSSGSMKFSKTGAGLRILDRYYDYHDWNIMQVAQRILRNAVEACTVCGSPAIRWRKQGVVRMETWMEEGAVAQGERPRAISRLIAQVLQVHPISYSRNTMEMDRNRNRCRSSLSPLRFVATRDRCKQSVAKKGEKKKGRKKERKMNRRNCGKSIIEVARVIIELSLLRRGH